MPWACERVTPPIFSWTSAAPSSLGPRTPFSSVLTLTPRPQDHGTRLTCQVKLPTSGAMAERTILLNVTCEWGVRMPGGSEGVRAVGPGWGCEVSCPGGPAEEGARGSQSLSLLDFCGFWVCVYGGGDVYICLTPVPTPSPQLRREMPSSCPRCFTEPKQYLRRGWHR